MSDFSFAANDALRVVAQLGSHRQCTRIFRPKQSTTIDSTIIVPVEQVRSWYNTFEVVKTVARFCMYPGPCGGCGAGEFSKTKCDPWLYSWYNTVRPQRKPRTRNDYIRVKNMSTLLRSTGAVRTCASTSIVWCILSCCCCRVVWTRNLLAPK